MGYYYNEFRKLFDEAGFHYEIVQDDDCNGIVADVDLENRQQVRALFMFDKEETQTDVVIGNITTITSVFKREEALKLVNKLNDKYRYGKIVMKEDGTIHYQHSLSLPNGEYEVFVMELIYVFRMMIKAVVDFYPQFMKLEWS